MDNSQGNPWWDNSNGPPPPPPPDDMERECFVGAFVGTISHGILIILFFRCMGAMLNRTRGDIRWGLVALTAAMFSFATITLSSYLDTLSISYSRDLNFPVPPGPQPGPNGSPFAQPGPPGPPPGPLGFQVFICRMPFSIIAYILLPVNQWLADGLLLYRCYVIYAMNRWVIALPSVMYLASVSMGIISLYECLQPTLLQSWPAVGASLVSSYFAIIFSLDVLLTLMIVARLVWYNKNVRNAMGDADGVGAWYRATITMFVESCAPYAISLLIYLGPPGPKGSVAHLHAFYPIVVETQVIAPLLVIQRVANRTALTSDVILSGPNVDPIRFRNSEESMSGDGTLPDERRLSSVGAHGEVAGGPGVEIETTSIEEVPL